MNYVGKIIGYTLAAVLGLGGVVSASPLENQVAGYTNHTEEDKPDNDKSCHDRAIEKMADYQSNSTTRDGVQFAVEATGTYVVERIDCAREKADNTKE